MSVFSKLFRKAVSETRISDAAEALIDSLRTAAGEWRLEEGRCYLSNDTLGARIWVANKDYALKVEMGTESWVPTGAERAAIWEAASELMQAHGHFVARRLASRITGAATSQKEH